MRYSLLAGVAVVALSLGAPLAYAQDQSGTQEHSGGAPGAEGSEMHGGASASHAGSSSRLNGGASLNGGGLAASGSGAGVAGSRRNADSGSNREGREQGMEENGSRRHLGSGAARHKHVGAGGYDQEHRNRENTGLRENGRRSPDEMGSRENRGGVSSYSRESAGSHEAGGREAAGARLAPEQRDRFVSAIRRDHVATSEHVDFALNAGVVVPGRYHFYPLPEDIVSFVPEYRGYDYLIADEQIVIIDPATHEIIDVIPEG